MMWKWPTDMTSRVLCFACTPSTYSADNERFQVCLVRLVHTSWREAVGDHKTFLKVQRPKVITDEADRARAWASRNGEMLREYLARSRFNPEHPNAPAWCREPHVRPWWVDQLKGVLLGKVLLPSAIHVLEKALMAYIGFYTQLMFEHSQSIATTAAAMGLVNDPMQAFILQNMNLANRWDYPVIRRVRLEQGLPRSWSTQCTVAPPLDSTMQALFSHDALEEAEGENEVEVRTFAPEFANIVMDILEDAITFSDHIRTKFVAGPAVTHALRLCHNCDVHTRRVADDYDEMPAATRQEWIKQDVAALRLEDLMDAA